MLSAKALMKGTAYNPKKMTFPALCQVKIDGIRARVEVQPDGTVIYDSYAGKPLYNLSHLDNSFRLLFEKFEGTRVFDVEILHNNFAETYSLVRSLGYPPGIELESTKAYLLDLPMDIRPLNERFHTLKTMRWENLDHIELPLTEIVFDDAGVQSMFTEVVAEGGEGVMVRAACGLYHKGSRSQLWQKLKKEITEDAVISKIHLAVGKDGQEKDWVGGVTVRMESGGLCTASTSKLSIDERRELARIGPALIGQWCEVRYMERDRASGYRHPVLIRLREPK